MTWRKHDELGIVWFELVRPAGACFCGAALEAPACDLACARGACGDPGCRRGRVDLARLPCPKGCAGRWTVYQVKAARTLRTPSGVLWRAMRDGCVLRRGNRVRSFRSQYAAQAACLELAGLGL